MINAVNEGALLRNNVHRKEQFSGIPGQIDARKKKIRQRTFIISVSRSSIMEPLTKDIGAFAVAKIVVSLQNSMSWLYVVFGATKWPSKNNNMSCLGSMTGDQQNITSLFSTPSHA